MLELVKQPQLPEDMVAWLFKAVRFRAINLSRAETRRWRYQQKAAQLQGSWFQPDPAASLQAEELKSALEALPVLEREIVIARIWGGLSFEQIAALVDRSTSSVHRRYAAALKCLQQVLEGTSETSRCHE